MRGGARDTEAHANIRQHTPAYVGLRQRTSGGARDSGASEAELAGQLGLEEAVEGGSQAHAGLSGAHCRLLLSPPQRDNLPLRLASRTPSPSLSLGALLLFLDISGARVREWHLSH